MNIAEIEMQLAELVREPFDRSGFAFRLLEIYNAPKSTLTKLRKGTQNKGEQQGDVLWARKMYFRRAEEGQTAQTLDALKNAKATKSQKPRFLIATDGREVSALDTKADDPLHCDFAELNDHFDFFLPLAGIDKYEAVKENPADIKATGRLAKLHDEIVHQNPDWTTDEKRHALNQFMTRILFCMFAEDTGSFATDLFIKTITEFGGDDGQHLQSLLRQIFDVMNVPEKERGDMPAHIRLFPYVNGGLFADQTEVPVFNKRAKRILIDAARLNWSEINPDIFGSMIQAIVHPDMRGDLGLHYTSVPNIMKVLQPLFLMSLEEEFAQAQGHREERSRLNKLLTRISKIRVFDPACGSGNFLIIAYRELRTIEMRIFKQIEELEGGQRSRHWSGVKLSNFFGIELADFAAETAKLSLWIAEYQMNQRFKGLFGEAPPNFPLADGGRIVCDNALRRDWLEICQLPTKIVQKQKVFDLATIAPVHATEEVIDQEIETYLVGNPPFGGAREQTPQQKSDLRFAMSKFDGVNSLDYVCGWFSLAARYIRECSGRAAFVATSSICQGQSISLFWKPILETNEIEIFFAYEPFKWKNNAKNNAAVSCVIVGIRLLDAQPKYLFDENKRRLVKNISPYLTDNPNVFVEKIHTTPGDRSPLVLGNQAIDGGHLIFSQEEMNHIVARDASSRRYMRPLHGADDFLKGKSRFCLWIREANLAEAMQSPDIAARVKKVQRYREAGGEVARSLVDIPYRFRYVHEANDAMIVVPRTSSENREYIPVGLLDSEAIVTDAIQVIYDPAMYIFSILSSRLHLSWARAVCGQLETRLRYSNTLAYNTFPIPPLSNDQKSQLETLAWALISTREAHPGKTIEWLYDASTMPSDLRAAHGEIDDSLEKIYIGRRFRSDTERLEYLFKMYGEMTAGKEKEAANA